MPADYIVKAVGGNVHRNAVIVSDSPRILGVLAASGRRDIPLRYALWTEDAWWDQRALPAYLTGFASATAGIWPCSLIPGKSL